MIEFDIPEIPEFNPDKILLHELNESLKKEKSLNEYYQTLFLEKENEIIQLKDELFKEKEMNHDLRFLLKKLL